MNRLVKGFCSFILAAAIIAPFSRAATCTWTGTTDLEELDGTTWDVAPVTGDTLNINNGHTAVLTTGPCAFSPAIMFIGATSGLGNGQLTINDGYAGTTFSATGTINCGDYGMTGTVRLDNGTWFTTGSLELGDNAGTGGQGYYIQNAGTATLNGALRAGIGAGSYGRADIIGGTISMNGNLVLGYANGKGKLVHTGGTIDAKRVSTSSGDSFFYVGYAGIGICEQSAGDTTLSVETGAAGRYILEIGGYNAGTGTSANPAYGYYKLTGGNLTVANNSARIGHYSVGVMEQSAGNFSVGAGVWVGGHWTTSLNSPNAFGVYTLSGGTAASNVVVHDDKCGIAGGGGTGIITICDAGQFTFANTASDDMFAIGGYTSSDTATLNLGGVYQSKSPTYLGGGGILSTSTAVRKFSLAATGQSDINFHGGTLKALPADGGNPVGASSFLAGTKVYIYREGANIDTNGTDITIDNNLEAPTAGQGVGTAFVVTDGGAGYMAPPVVKFTSVDGNGSGATGYAVMAGGSVASIVLTNPGTGYTAAPTISLLACVAGTNNGLFTTQATATAALNGGNASGGLTKLGLGTLTLSGANSYTGATTVSAGTLALAATGQIAASSSIANDAAFSVLDGTHTVNAISGTGTTNVYGTASLTAPSIVQGALNIGGIAPVAAAAVPEPSTITLLVFAGLTIVGTCLRRK
jgi:fibronectin-binding autotransporter adhesin